MRCHKLWSGIAQNPKVKCSEPQIDGLGWLDMWDMLDMLDGNPWDLPYMAGATGPLAPDESFVQSFYGGGIFEGIHRGSLHLVSFDRSFEAVSRKKLKSKQLRLRVSNTHSVPPK